MRFDSNKATNDTTTQQKTQQNSHQHCRRIIDRIGGSTEKERSSDSIVKEPKPVQYGRGYTAVSHSAPPCQPDHTVRLAPPSLLEPRAPT
jgi:hypothetical protein